MQRRWDHGGPEDSALIYSLSHPDLKAIWAPPVGRENDRGGLLRPRGDAEFTAQMGATQLPPALLEPLLSHAPQQPGAGLGFASVSQDKPNQKVHLKLKVLLQVTKVLLSARPQSLERNWHCSDSLRLGR